MTERDFSREIVAAPDDERTFAENILARGLPILIFGAGDYARNITNMLDECGVKIDGYLVDDEYYIPNSTYLNRPIFSFSEIFADKSKKYILIRGTTNPTAWRNAKKRVAPFPGFTAYEFIQKVFYTLAYNDIDDEKNFLKEISAAPDDRKTFAENILARGLPILVFGAGDYARNIANMLDECGVKIDGYLVDDEYYIPNSTYLNRPIFSFSEIFADESKKYILIRGVNNLRAWRTAQNRVQDSPQFVIYEFIKENFYTLTYDEIFDKKDKFFETYTLLEDEFSRETFITCLKAHLSLSPLYLESIADIKEYFNDLTEFAITRGGTFVDCGAYKGDTVEKFINSGGGYEKIFAIEPDEKNFIQLQQFIKEKAYKNIVLCNCGVSDKKGTVTFESRGGPGSKISEIGENTINVDTIDNIVGNESVSLIKMDVEGAELSALRGAVNTLKRCKPALALSVYHRKEDLITIPQFIKSIYKDCKFYLRQYRKIDLADLDLYVIPD